MLSKRSRVLLCSGLAPLALTVTTGSTLAQTSPAARPAAPPAPAAPAAAPPPAPAPSSGASPAPAAPDLPKSRMQTELETRLHAMRSGKGLTADEVARRSVKNSAALEAKRHAVAGVEEAVSQTKGAFWPQLKLSASYMRLSPAEIEFVTAAGPAVIELPENSYSLDAALTVPLSDYVLRLSHAIAATSHAREAAELDRQATYASVSRDARVAYYQWIRAQANELIARQSLEQATGHHGDAQNAFQVGLVSKADVLRTQAAVRNAELFLERARNAAEMGRIGLQVSMGDTTRQRYEIGEDIFAHHPELDSLPQPEAALKEALSRRVELRGLVAAEKGAREEAANARVNGYPRLDGQASFTYANPNPRAFPPAEKFNESWQAGVVLSWIPTNMIGANASAGIADARAAELAAQRRGLHDALRLEIEQALTSAAEARHAIDASHQTLAAVDESYRVRRELFRAGRATLVEVTDAETELTNTRLHLADAYVQARIALTQLHHALGRDTEPARPASR
jgi:outer membrane protein TolC